MTTREPLFRVLALNASNDDGNIESQNLKQILYSHNNGFFAFYSNTSGVVGLAKSSARALRTQLLSGLGKKADDEVIDPCSEVAEVNIESRKGEVKILPGHMYMPGLTLQRGYPAKMGEFLGGLRRTLNKKDNPFRTGKGYTLNHATGYDLLGDPHEHSPLLLKEYLLWDDGGLWGGLNWQKTRLALMDRGMKDSEAEQRMAWTGAGWMSLQFEQVCQQSKEVWPSPPELDAYANSALVSLEQYDEVLKDYFTKQQNRNPPTFKPYTDYIRCLCNFLPDHRSRTNSSKWLNSTTWGEIGGPRLWRGIMDGRLHMHLIHLLLDGWLTLWPATEPNGRTRLYLQPGSLSLLYWAAHFADMPHTETPQSFLENYNWADGENPWFGGQRRFWKP